MRLRLLAPTVTIAALLLTAGCSSTGPSDEPLPTVVQLRAEFERQPEGRGFVRESNGGLREPYEVTARHSTSSVTGQQGTISTFTISLESSIRGLSVNIIGVGINGDHLIPGREYNAGFSYSGVGGGNGLVGITAADNGRIEGVFATDIAPNGYIPDFRRVRGAFNAVYEPRPVGR